MQYKKYECKAYNIHTVKTDKYKSCIIEVIFRDNIIDNKIMSELLMLRKILCSSNKNYKNKRELCIKREELYNAFFQTNSSRIGESYELSFSTEFINPYYIKEENYIDELISFSFDMILNPDVNNDEFNLKKFNVAKESTLIGIDKIHESGPRFSIKRALENMDPNSLSSKYITKEEIELMTPSSLYKTYNNIITSSICDVYVIGDLDMDDVVEKINKYLNLKVIKNHELNLYVDNKKRKKALIVKETDEFVQANLVVGYNVDELNDKEKIIVKVFIEIFGGGITSKLFQNLREKNSLCYGVRPIYYKYDNLLFVHVSFDEENYDKAMKLINSSMDEMKKGIISDEEFDRAIKSLLFSTKMTKDSIGRVLDNYIFNDLGQIPLIDEIETKLLEITKEDVINISKKFTLNFTYLLGKDGENK